MNCNDLFRMFEDKLPNTSELQKLPKKSEIDNPTVKACRIYVDYITKNLDLYADFDEQTRKTVFIKLLDYKIQSEPNNSERYKFVHYCVRKIF